MQIWKQKHFPQINLINGSATSLAVCMKAAIQMSYLQFKRE